MFNIFMNFILTNLTPAKMMVYFIKVILACWLYALTTSPVFGSELSGGAFLETQGDEKGVMSV